MKIAVCIKFSVDVAQIRADEQTGAPRLDGVPWRVGTFDEHAIEAAVQLKERHGGTVVALSLVAAPPPQDLALKALAMGVDALDLWVDPTAEEADALATSTLLAAALGTLGGVDLVLCGEGSIDHYNEQVGPRLAEALDLPSVTYATRIEIAGRTLEADRLLEDRVVTVACELPAVVTVGQEINEPRLPAVLQVLGAGRKPTTVRPVDHLGVGRDAAALGGTRTLDVRAPPGQRKREPIQGESPDDVAAKLVRILVAEGVVRP